MTQKCKIDNEESDGDKLLSERHDLGLSGRNAERNPNSGVFSSQNTICTRSPTDEFSISPKNVQKLRFMDFITRY